MKHMRTTLSIAALVLATALVPTAPAAPAGDSFLFVTFELGDVVARAPFQGTFRATFANATAETTLAARAGDALAGSLSLPVEGGAGSWSVELATLAGVRLLRVGGELSAEGIRILGSEVDSGRLDLPRDTTSLRVVKGHVSATVALVGHLRTPDCCSATLGIDADADGEISAAESQTVRAVGREVRATVSLARAAPSVPYLFTVTDGAGRVVARASGTYSFTKLNGVSANGEFDPAVVEHVTGSVDRVPHLVQHDIGSSILLQTVAGSAKETDGPRVFFTMGTPGATAPAETRIEEGAPQETVATETAGEPAPRAASWVSATLALVMSPTFLAIVVGAFVAAFLAFAARRMLDRTA